MTNYKHSLWFAPTLLVVALIVMLGTTVSISAHAAKKISLTDQKKIKVRKEEEHSLKKEDKLYTRQAQAQAKQYKNTAELVKRQGGDPQPLIDAAAYFKAQSNIK